MDRTTLFNRYLDLVIVINSGTLSMAQHEAALAEAATLRALLKDTQ